MIKNHKGLPRLQSIWRRWRNQYRGRRMKDSLISSAAAKVQVKSVMRLTSALLFSACACVAADFPENLKKDIDAGNQAWVDGLKELLLCHN
jgi:hypothetical protein